MALIIGEVLFARSEDSLVSVNAWGAYRFSYAINIIISSTWLQNVRIDLANIGALAQGPNREPRRYIFSGPALEVAGPN